MAEKRDYYEVLGIDKNADDATIKKAYRGMAKKYHPDLNPGDATAEEKFKEVNEAYSVLSDADKKAKYDRYGHAAFEQGGGGGAGGFGGFGGDFDFGDLFGSFFGGGRSRRNPNAPVQGDDLRYRLNLTFEEACFGCKKEISFQRIESCAECGGSGAEKGSAVETCTKCRGTGRVYVRQQTMLGVMQTEQACDACRGKGKIVKNPCRACRGSGVARAPKKLEVTIPAGIDDGQVVILRGQGNAGKNGGPSGDLQIVVNVRPHPIFLRDGYDIYCEEPITFTEAALGATIEIPTLEGRQKYDIPEGTQSGKEFVLRGKGVQVPNSRSRGDLHVTVVVETPKNLTAEQKELLERFAALEGGTYTARKSFFEKLKDKFGK